LDRYLQTDIMIENHYKICDMLKMHNKDQFNGEKEGVVNERLLPKGAIPSHKRG